MGIGKYKDKGITASEFPTTFGFSHIILNHAMKPYIIYATFDSLALNINKLIKGTVGNIFDNITN